MTLIKSISGIRGTVGGQQGDNLTPFDVVKFASGFGEFIKQKKINPNPKVVLGRDARISGFMYEKLVSATLNSLGIDVILLGLTTTPTTEMAVIHHGADGGIILTASHNPKQWNALKLLNAKGEFLSATDGDLVLRLSEKSNINFSTVNELGSEVSDENALERHINAILALPLVDARAIAGKNFKIVVDAVNSTGGIAVPLLLEKLGCSVVELYCTPDGHFPHNPEPLPEHLTEISKEVLRHHANLGIVVDPDVDRLALVCEDGDMFGEEYTLVAVADYVLINNKGNTVSNLSSSRALRDITEKHDGNYFASAVGEVNVVELMKDKQAIIGGEGNGGIIYPELHYGRDALAGIALFLTHLAKNGLSVSQLRSQYPPYFISKNKIELTDSIDIDNLLIQIKNRYSQYDVITIDGVKINFDENKEWVHLRKSNTEPIIRIYAESHSMTTAENLAGKIMSDIKEIIHGS